MMSIEERSRAWAEAPNGAGIEPERLIVPKAARPRKEIGQRGRFRPDIVGARDGAAALGLQSLRELAKAEPSTFGRRIESLISEGKLRLRDVAPSLGSLYRLLRDVVVRAEMDAGFGERAAVDSSAFPLVMGALVVAAFNDAYDSVPSIGDQLVPREIEDAKKTTTVAKITGLVQKNLAVKEGDEFPMISAGEEFSTIGSLRKGFQLALSQETLEEGGGPGFLDLVDQGGTFAAELAEEQTLSRVSDQNGSAAAPSEPYAWHRNGTGTQLYNATANTPTNQTPSGTRVQNNALASTVSLDNVRAVLAAMLNTRGKRIGTPMSEMTLLVPDALAGIALKCLGSELEPGVANEVNNWGPRGRYRPMLATTPKLDDISTTAWYLGAFGRQFRRKIKIRMETVSVTADPMQYLRTREAYRTRIAWDFEVGAVDNVFVVQSLSGTTAPSAAS